MHLARSLAGSGAKGAVPDGMRWNRERNPYGTVEEKVVLWLLGSERSTESRRDKLAKLARRLGLDLRLDPDVWGEAPATRRRSTVDVRRCALRVSAPATDLWEMPARLAPLLGDGWTRIDLLPGAGVLNVAYEVDPDVASPLVESSEHAYVALHVASHHRPIVLQGVREIGQRAQRHEGDGSRNALEQVEEYASLRGGFLGRGRRYWSITDSRFAMRVRGRG